MSHSTPVVVREVSGTTLTTLQYAPWPVTYDAGPVRGMSLASVPVRAPAYVVTLVWGYLPNDALAQLWALPIDRQTDWWLPIPGAAGSNQTWGWVRGTLSRPAGDLTTWTRAHWDRMTWRLLAATIV